MQDREPDTEGGAFGDVKVRVVDKIADIDAGAWDALANPPGRPYHPFVAHAFLASLEDAGCVGGRTGWQPCHLAIEDGDGILIAAAPCYLKSHSQGEFIFDHGWAQAYEQAGGRYYPKLLIGVPFTPVPGPRLMVRDDEHASLHRQLLAAGAIELAERNGFSSVHLNFVAEDVPGDLRGLAYLPRFGQQFHWHNDDYETFDAFTATLASRKRKAVRKERASAIADGIEIIALTGDAIGEDHWDAMHAFYEDTGARKWGRPYLNRTFFTHLGERMRDHCLLVLAKRGERFIAGALNMIGGDCLYGRYWGAIEHHPNLHFEVCYYQAIDYAIAHGLARVEAGAQGEHKIARGYRPVETYSAHWIADPGLRQAVAQFLRRERAAVVEINAELNRAGPYRRDG